MAVVVQCYHCSNILELDEGFRGGVCRCSECGSLLQVPKASSTGTPKARPAAPGAAVTQPQRPANPNADPGLSRGQFDPKNQVPQPQDLGGSSSGLSRARPSAPSAVSAPPKIEKVTPLSGPSSPVHQQQQKAVGKNNMLLLVAGAIGFLLLVIVVVIVVVVASSNDKTTNTGGGTTNTNTGSSGGGGTPEVKPPERVVVKGPNFATLPLVGKRIVIAVDAASSMQDSFDYVRRAVYQAVESLETDQRLMVAVWTSDGVKQVPSAGFVGKGELRTIREQLDDVPTRGSTDAARSMKAALGVGGDQVIFVTAKFGLMPDLAPSVLASAKPGQRIDGLKITAEDNPSPLQMMADKTNGRFLFITQTQLEEIVRH